MARTNLDGLFHMDKRFDYLGKLTGAGKHDSRSRVLDLWHIAIDRLDDIMSSKEIGIQSELGPDKGLEFAECLVEADLAESLGDDRFRLRGVAHRSEWLAKQRTNGKRGGRPRNSENKPPENPKPKPENPNQNPETQINAPLKTETPQNLIVMDKDMDMDTDKVTNIFISDPKTKIPKVKVLISDALKARHDCLDPTQARREIGEVGWNLLMRQFSTWDRFCQEYNRARKTGYDPKFTKDLEEALEGRLETIIETNQITLKGGA